MFNPRASNKAVEMCITDLLWRKEQEIQMTEQTKVECCKLSDYQ